MYKVKPRTWKTCKLGRRKKKKSLFTDGGTVSFRSLRSDDERMERSEETRVPLAGGGGMSAGTSAWSGSSPGGWGWMLCEACGWGGGSGGEPGGRPPDGSLMLGGLQQASVVGHDLVLGQVQVELQRHEDGELEGYQLSPVHSEPLLQFLWGDRMEGFFTGHTRYVSSCSQGLAVSCTTVDLDKRRLSPLWII